MSTPPLADTLAQLDRWYAEHVPAIHANLRPGATDAELDALEKHIGFKLPEDFRILYKWHNGTKGILNSPFGLSFIDINNVTSEWDTWKELEPDFGHDEFEEHISHPKGAITERYINTGWLAFLVDGGGNSIGIDLQPDKKGKVGQVINFGRDEENKYVLADSLGDFVREYWTCLEKNQVVVNHGEDLETLDGYKRPLWEVKIKALPNQARNNIYSLADLYPGFGASPAVRAR